MNTNTVLYGQYGDPSLSQIVTPKIVDVSSVDYNAEKLNVNTGAIDSSGEVRPFIICSNQEVVLKVQTWSDVTITWTFTAGTYPMLLRKIYNDAANTLTTVQIGY